MANANPSNNTDLTSVRMEGGNENESTPREQRDPIGNCPKTEGPVQGESGNFEKAEYPIGDPKSKVFRRDR